MSNGEKILFDINAETLSWAYRKLKAYYYSQKGPNHIKSKIIAFERKLMSNSNLFEEIALELKNSVDSENWVSTQSIGFIVYPKKDAFFQHNGKIALDRYNAFIDVDISYYLVDVIFALNLMANIGEPHPNSYAFNPAKHFKRAEGILNNIFLFEHYWEGYQKWMKVPNAAFAKKDASGNVVVKLDLKECFYHMSFNFRKVVKDLGIENDISLIMGSVFRQYSSKVLMNKYGKKKETNQTLLPVGLLSSSVLQNYLFYCFDEKVVDSPNIVSYGRFVDDMYFVFRSDEVLPLDVLLSDLTSAEKNGESQTMYLKKFGYLAEDLPINEKKTALRFVPAEEKETFKLSETSSPSFVSDLQDSVFERERIVRVTDSDITVARSIRDSYNSNDYQAIKEAIWNLTACDLLNAWSLWIDFFRIINENDDSPFAERLRDKISYYIDGFSMADSHDFMKSSEELSGNAKFSLRFELNFAVENSRLKSSDLAYMFSPTSEEIESAIEKSLNGEELYYPCLFTIVQLSYFHSKHALALSQSLINDICVSYKRLNCIESIDDFQVTSLSVRENVEGLFTLTSSVNSVGTDGVLQDRASNPFIRVALGCLPMKYFEGSNCYEEYAKVFGNLGKYSLFELKKVVDAAANKGASYLVLPEFAVKINDVVPLADYCRKKKLSAVFGVEHFVWKNYARNLTCIFDCRSNLVLFKEKNYIPLGEMIVCKKAGYEILEPPKMQYFIVDDGKLVYSSMTCYEATNIKDRAKLAGRIQSLFIPVFNKDTPYFSNIIESFSRDASIFIAQSNCNGYGDSRIRAPMSSVKADIVRIKGGINLYCVVGEINTSALEKDNLTYLEQKKVIDDYSGTYKPLSAGDIHFDSNS